MSISSKTPIVIAPVLEKTLDKYWIQRIEFVALELNGEVEAFAYLIPYNLAGDFDAKSAKSVYFKEILNSLKPEDQKLKEAYNIIMEAIQSKLDNE